MRGGGFPDRAARGLSLLLYSPDSHGEHIKCSPARAELATEQSPPSASCVHLLVGYSTSRCLAQVIYLKEIHLYVNPCRKVNCYD